MQTVLITGATDGIGRETARQLLDRGFRVLVHGCTLEKAQRVVAEFQRAQPEAAAEAVYADLARMWYSPLLQPEFGEPATGQSA